MGWAITSTILGIYLGDISANSVDTHRLRVCVIVLSVASSVRFCHYWHVSRMDLFNVLYVYTRPRQDIG